MTISAKEFNRLQEMVDYLRKQLDENGNADRRERVEFSQKLSRLETKIETFGQGGAGGTKQEIRDLRKCLDDNTVNDKVERSRLEEKIKKLEAELKSNTENDVRVGEELQLIVNAMKVSKTWFGRGVVIILFGALLWLLMQFIQFTVSGKHIVDSLQIAEETTGENSLWGWMPVESMEKKDLMEMANKLPFETAVKLDKKKTPTLGAIVDGLPQYVVEKILEDDNLVDQLFEDEYFEAQIVKSYFESRRHLIATFDVDQPVTFESLRILNTDPFNVIINPSSKDNYGNKPNCPGRKRLSEILDGVELIIPSNWKGNRVDNSILRYLNCNTYWDISTHVELKSTEGILGKYRIDGFQYGNVDEVRVIVPPDLLLAGEKLKPGGRNIAAEMTIVSVNGKSITN